MKQSFDIKCRTTYDDGSVASLHDVLDPRSGRIGKLTSGKRLGEVQFIDKMMRDSRQFCERRLSGSDGELPVDLTTVCGDNFSLELFG
jgi:hypothetical protein